MRRSRLPAGATLVVVAALALAGCSAGDERAEPSPPAAGTSSPAAAPADDPAEPDSEAVPALEVAVITDQLEHGWDIGFLPDGGALVTERSGRLTHLSSLDPGAAVTRVADPLPGVMARGEGGLLGMVVHPDFESSRELTVCLNHQESGVPADIRLVTYRLADDDASVERVRDLLTGIPTGSGRHSGCRPTIAADGSLVVGTGDIADGSMPQDLGRLGGKVLRLDLRTGEPAPDNPFIDAAGDQRYVLSFGHRNIQGVAIQPGTGEIYTAEHGPSVEDEVNRIMPGGNYGWDPSRGGTTGGYDESVPMTDLDRFPDAVPAVWDTGAMTEAISGATFLEGSQWGAWDGALLVVALAGAKAVILTLDDDGEVAEVAYPEELDGEFGRLRAARLGPDGALYVTTSNGDADRLLRLTPRTG